MQKIFDDQESKAPDRDEGWYDGASEEAKKHAETDDSLENSWDADNSGYDEGNPESKADKSVSPEGLKEREAEGIGSSKNSSGSMPGENNNFGTDSFYSGKNEGNAQGAKFWTRRRKGIGAGAAGGIVVGGVAMFSLLSGPAQFVHFAQLMQKFHFSNNEELGNGRTYRYFRSWNSGGRGNAKMQTRLGVIGNKIANNMEIKLQKEGLRSVYDKSTGNLIGYQYLDDAGSKTRAVDLITNADLDPNLDIDTKPAAAYDGIAADSKGRPLGSGAVIDVKTIDGKQKLIARRKFGKGITKGIGLGKIASAVGFRATARRNGVDLHPMHRLDRKADEKLTDFTRKIKEALKEKFKNGVKPPDDVNLRNDNEPGPSGDAETEGRTTQAEAKVDPDGAKSKLRSKLAIGGSVIGVLCAARSISDNIETVKYANIILPMIRMGTHTVAVGNQVMNGKDASMDELGVLSKDLYDADKKLGWTSARSIQAELGEPQTGPDIPPTAKPSRAGEKPTFLNVIDAIFGKVGKAGDAACSTIGQFLIDAVSGDIISGIVSEIVGSLASAAGVNPLDMFSEWIINVLAGDQVDVSAKGPDLGNIVNYGARLAANDQALSMGGAKLSDTNVAELDADSRDALRNELKQQNFFARMFDINEPTSVVAKAAFENPNLVSAQAAISSSARSSINLLPSLGGTFANMLTQSVGAQGAQAYDYGFDEYGFDLNLQEDARFEDPYENASIVEKQLGQLNSDYDSCFTMKVNPDTFRLETDSTDRYEEPPEKCNDTSDLSLLRYRFYLADSVVGNALACYEADDAEGCANAGFSNQTSAGSTSTTATSQIVGDIGESSDKVACAPGTKDMGVTESKYDGEFRKSVPLMIRLCQIPDLPGEGVSAEHKLTQGGAIVNSRVSGAWLALAQKAKTDGINLVASSSFRWEHSCGGGGDGTACAEPGKSPHQLGVAIDFNQMGQKGGSTTSCSGRALAYGNDGWEWLLANAEKFGFKQYSYEPWHWDPLPMENRCGTTQLPTSGGKPRRF